MTNAKTGKSLHEAPPDSIPAVRTIAVDAVTFMSPVHVGDEVSLYAERIETGRTSMKIKVEARRRPRYSEEIKHVTEAIFTVVALGDDGKSRPLPDITE